MSLLWPMWLGTKKDLDLKAVPRQFPPASTCAFRRQVLFSHLSRPQRPLCVVIGLWADSAMVRPHIEHAPACVVLGAAGSEVCAGDCRRAALHIRRCLWVRTCYCDCTGPRFPFSSCTIHTWGIDRLLYASVGPSSKWWARMAAESRWSIRRGSSSSLASIIECASFVEGLHLHSTSCLFFSCCISDLFAPGPPRT
ncbi:hypothetical protein C8R47DRAFT_604141 [Mycena vitilis]|nr:hypothetical protein C8R47DRAFT_604141 [Mycena vitilis]